MLSRRMILSAYCVIGGCSYATVESGHGAVLMTPGGDLSTLDEGVSSVPPFSQVDDFNLRQQAENAVLRAVTADGVPVVASESVVTYHIVPADLVAIDREIGPDYLHTLIEPIVQSSVRRVLASYRLFDLDTAHLREAEARISALSAEQLQLYHIVLESVALKGVTPELPTFGAAVSDTAVWEQRALEARTKVDIARQAADKQRQDAQGIAAANNAVAPTLSPTVLQDAETRAWGQLLKSPSTSLRVLDSPARLEISP